MVVRNMTFDEMCEAIYRVRNDMLDAHQVPGRVIINKKYKRYMLDIHKRYTRSNKVEAIFGVPLEFRELPDNLNFIVETTLAWPSLNQKKE